MKLALTVGKQTFDIEFNASNGLATLTHNEQTHTAHISTPEPGFFTVLLNNRVYHCLLDELPGGQTEVVVNSQRLPVTVRDKKNLRGNADSAVASGKATLTAPMPGKVVRVLCAVGDEVTAQQGLLVVEAMKMQNEVQAPKTGKVTEIRAREGQTVNAGDVLAIVE